MANKSIRELVIKVKQQNAIKVAKDVERISEALLDATEYADMFNASLAEMTVPEDLNRFITTFEKMEESLEEIATQTRRTTNSLDAFRRESIDSASAAQEAYEELGTSLASVGERIEDVGTDVVRTGKQTSDAVDTVGTALGEATVKTDKFSKSSQKANNRMKDMNRQGTNTVRNFSAMAQKAGGLASAYALVAANVFAVTEGFRLLSDAASVARLEEISSVISSQLGVSIEGTARAIQEATDYTVSWQQALRQASAATAYGFSTEQIEDFTQVARRAAVVLGVEMTDALNRVVRGISKAEVELLDELGITVRLNEAFAEYANQHNLSANALNSYQRQQALANEVIRKSAINLGAADDALRSTSWERFGAQVSTATNQMLQFISTSETLTDVLNSITNIMETLTFKSRTESLSTPFTEALADSKTLSNQLVAFNNLQDETLRIDEKRVAINKQINELLAKGATRPDDLTGRASAQLGISTDGSADEIRDMNREVDLLHAELAALTREYLLGKDASGEYFETLGGSLSDIRNAGDAVQNLRLQARTLSSDLTSLNGDLTEASGKYDGLGSSISEVTKDIRTLQAAGVGLDEALKLAGVTSAQFNNFGDIQKYVKLLDDQKEAQVDIVAMQNESTDTVILGVMAAQKELQLLQDRQTAEMAVLDITTKTADQKIAILNAENKIAAATRKYQAEQLDNLQKQQQLSFGIKEAEGKFNYESAIGAASRELALQQAILDTMIQQNAAAAANGQIQPYSQQQIEDQRDTTTNAGLDRQSTIQASNVQAQQAALASLNPDIASATTNVYQLADAWKIMGDQSATASEVAAASASAMSSTLGAISGMVSAAAGASTSAIDAEIAAVKASGMTQEEQEAKTKELNKKKIKEQEKYAKASILISTAQGIMLAFATSGNIYAGMALAAVTAATGALAYQQASNSAASQLSALESSTSSGTTTLTVGEENTNMSSDLSQSATQAERSQSLGDEGIYGRAAGGNMYKGNSYLVGENGKELITPKQNMSITPESQAKGGAGGRATNLAVNLQVSAFDSTDLETAVRDKLIPSIEEVLEQEGRKLAPN